MLARRPSLVGALVLAALACSSKDDPNDWSYSGPRSACSTGAPYESQLTELTPAQSEAARGAPECVPRCGVAKGTYGHYGSTWTVAALPSGACSFAGEVCSMAAVRTLDCADGTTIACSFTGYVCRCEGATWRCYVDGGVGASACICNLDAGRD